MYLFVVHRPLESLKAKQKRQLGAASESKCKRRFDFRRSTLCILLPRVRSPRQFISSGSFAPPLKTCHAWQVSKPLIFFPTVAAGGGHVATARAMAQALEAIYPGEFEVQVSDYMLELGEHHPDIRRFDEQHKASWKVALRYPLLARWGQRVLDSVPTLTRTVQRQQLRSFAKVAAEDLERRAPALIVANHPFLAVGLTLAQHMSLTLRGGGVPIINFATEPLDASALWAEPRAERFAAPSRAARDDLIRLGVPGRKVDLVGYPVQQSFLYPPSKEEARRTLGLSEAFTCLVSLGGEGVGGQVERVVQALVDEEVQVVAIAGRNEGLRGRLESLAHPNLTVKGFVNDMAPHLAACDLIVGKAGPASVMEALAVGRPVLATSYAGLNERKLIRFVESRRLGAYVPNLERLGEEVRRYGASPERLSTVTERCAKLGLGEMTEQIARYLARAAIHGLPKERFEGRGLD